MKWISYGPDGLLVQFADRVDEEAFRLSRTLTAFLEAEPPVGLVEFTPGYTSVLLEFDPRMVGEARGVADEVVALLRRAGRRNPPEARVVEMGVVYDGPDLGRVAEVNGLTVEEVCRLHCEGLYRVYLLGFSPGFPYLGDLNPRLHTPRLSIPRARVAAGSVAIGGEHTGIYSVDSPGGWNVIGHTRTRLFDPGAGDPGEIFRLRQGDQVRFVREDGGGA